MGDTVRDNFDDALAHTLEFEGGYSNNPADPGGPTMCGVTLATYSAFLGREATVVELKAIPQEHLLAIYGQHYWDACRCDDLPGGLDACVFDFSVNSGAYKAIKALQALAGAKQDGVVGPKTLAAVAAWVRAHGLKNAIALYQHERQEYMERLATFPIFGKGWTRRVNDMTKFAHTLM
jgi:lysozyme family protein